MLSDVRQRTIEPVITGAVAAGSLVHTDEYVVYARLPAWGYRHKLPLYLGFFQFVHNARRRGKALLGALVAALVACPNLTTPKSDKSVKS